MTPPTLGARAARWYVRVLRCYPAGYRARFERGMLDGFAEELDAARRRGRLAATWCWCAAIVDAVRYGLAARRAEAVPARPRLSVRLEGLWQDARYGARGLIRSPGFAATALVVMAVGIGLSTSLFGLMDGLLYRPWPLPDADRVVAVYGGGATGAGDANTSPVKFRYLRDRAQTLDLVAHRDGYLRLGLAPDEELMASYTVSGNYFSTLRVPIAQGRGIQVDEDVIDRPVPVVVISHGLWTRRFGRSETIVGQAVRLNDVEFTIVGVTGAGARTAESAPDVWVPLAMTPLLNPGRGFDQDFLRNPDYCCVRLAGRLRGDATSQIATVELAALVDQYNEAVHAGRAGMIVAGTWLADQPGGTRVLQVFAMVMAALLLLLVVACANVGNLHVARAMRRRRELTIRYALGASRWRVVRQLLAESVVLAGLAATLAVLGAFVLPRLVFGMLDAPDLDLTVGIRVPAFAAALAMLTVVTSSLAPALQATRRLASTQRAGDEPRLRLRSGLLAVQVATSTVLLVGAALFGRSLIQVSTFDPGFDVAEVSVLSVFAPPNTVDSTRQDAMIDSVRASFAEADLPLGEVNTVPLSDSRFHTSIWRPDEAEDEAETVYTLDVSPGYFDVLGLRLTGGQAFGSSDTSGAIMINETLAERLWPGEPAVGRTLRGGGMGGDLNVVGVVADAYLANLDRVEPTLFRQRSSRSVGVNMRALLVRTDPAQVSRARAAALAVEPEGRVTARALRSQFENALALPRIAAAIAGAIGLVAMVLASVGVFGVFSFVVQERASEIGIRMALGARGRQVVGLVFRQTSWPLVAGLTAGLGVAMAAAPMLRAYLVGIGPYDAPAFVAVIVVLALAACAATVVPVRRATRVDPAVTLRQE